MRSDRSLYQRLTEFALDDESAGFKFSNRLARENGWSLAFAKRAIEEYKRFVYLAAISKTPITPSDVVDQVWHLHLTYTHSYWDELCRGVLKRPLHHGPTKGGAQEDAKYRNLYAATLAAYRREFGEEPPRDVWPDADARFAGAAHQRWIDTRTHLVVTWRSVRRALAILTGAGALTSAGVAFAAGTPDAARETGPAALVIGGLIVVVIALAAAHNRRKSKPGSDGGGYWGGSGCSSGGRSDSHHGGHGHDGGGHGCSGGDGGGSGCSGGGCGGGGCSGS